MKQYEPIPIHPLRLKGVFGVTWKLFARNSWSVFAYTLIFIIITALLFALALAPFGASLATGFVKSGISLPADADMFKLPVEEWWRALEEACGGSFSFSYDPSGGFNGDMMPEHFPKIEFDWQQSDKWEQLLSAMNGAMVAATAVLSLVLCVMAFFIALLVIRPAVMGTLADEMALRVNGASSSLGELFGRTGGSLKRFFTAQLALIVGNLLLGIVKSAVFGLLAAGVAVAIAPLLVGSVFLMGLPLIIAAIALVALVLFLVIFFNTLFSMTFPAAANGQKGGFSALWRSVRTAFSSFKRVMGANIMLKLVLAGISLFQSVTVWFCAIIGEGAAAICALAWLVINALIFVLLTPYKTALGTVLYLDGEARRAARRSTASAPAPAVAAAAAEGGVGDMSDDAPHAAASYAEAEAYSGQSAEADVQARAIDEPILLPPPSEEPASYYEQTDDDKENDDGGN